MISDPPALPPDDDDDGFWSLLRRRNYRLIWTSQLISGLGDRIQWVAVVLWVWELTGSALSVSFALISSIVAPAIVGFYAGAVVDRFNRRLIMIAADLVRGLLVLILPSLVTFGMPFVYLDLFVVSIASGFFRPAMFAMIPQSVPKKRLLKANAFFASMDSSTEVIGPALGGVLIPFLGFRAGFYVNALSFLCSALLISRIRLPAGDPAPAPGQAVAARSREPIWRSVIEGLEYVRRDPIQVALLTYVLAAQWVVGLTSLQTPLAREQVGVTIREFGWFQSIWGLGFVAASVAVGWSGQWARRGQSIVFGYALWALAALGLGMSQNLGMLVIAGFWVGFANTVVFINVSTVMMQHTPNTIIGRAITTRQVVVAIVRVGALLFFGWLADLISVRASIAAMAVLSLSGTILVTLAMPQLWRYVGPAVAPEARDLFRPIGEQLRGSLGVALAFIMPRADRTFEPAEQSWLDRATATIALFGWGAMLLLRPAIALGTAVVVLCAVLAALMLRLAIRWIGRRRLGPG
jgi:MFS family permease